MKKIDKHRGKIFLIGTFWLMVWLSMAFALFPMFLEGLAYYLNNYEFEGYARAIVEFAPTWIFTHVMVIWFYLAYWWYRWWNRVDKK